MLPLYQESRRCFNEYGLELTQEVYQKLDRYAEILCETNKVINLTAITDPEDVLIKHFIDSIILTKYIDFKPGSKVIDVGTGAGFPLLPVKIFNDSIDITLMDGLNKRINFLKDLCSELGVEAQCIHGRAELMARDYDYREKYDICVARAVSPMPVLCEYCLGFVKVSGIMCAMKGPSEDINLAQNAVKILGGKISEQIEYDLNKEQRKIVVVKKITQTSAKYPRSSNKISSKPL